MRNTAQQTAELSQRSLARSSFLSGRFWRSFGEERFFCLICDPGHQLSPVRFPAYMLRKRVAVSMSASAGLPIFSRTLKEPSVVAEDEAVRSGEWPMCRPARSQACSVVDGVESNVSACGRLNLERWLLAGRCCRTMACVACVLTPIATPPS